MYFKSWADLKIGLILDGGAFGGAYGAGWLKAYDKVFGDKRPYNIQSVSVGNLNGASFIQYGNARTLLYIWLDLIAKKGPSFIFDRNWKHIFLSHEHLYDAAGIDFLINQMDFNEIVKQSLTRFDIIATNQNTEDREIFSTADEDVKRNPEILKKAARASVALPGVFSSVSITRNLNGVETTADYSDGYMYSIRYALDIAGCDIVFICSNDPMNHTHRDFRAWYNKFDYSRHLLTKFGIQRELKKYENDRRVVLLRLEEGVPTLRNDVFEKGDIEKAINMAYEAGVRILGRKYNELTSDS